MNACNGRPSVCTESVQSTVCRCVRVARVITVGAGAHVQAVNQLNEHHVIHARNYNNKTQPVSRALDVIASKCRHACTSNHSQNDGFVS